MVWSDRVGEGAFTWVLACARIAGEACHILRTDHDNTSAAAAGFSSFHFHRVFKSLLGETLNQFVKRLRLERALYLMSHAPNRSLTDVALGCGFSSSSDFSRSFKQCYGAAPSVFDLELPLEQAVEGYRAMDRREAIKVLLRP